MKCDLPRCLRISPGFLEGKRIHSSEMRIRFKAGEERRGSLFFTDTFLEFHSKVKSNTIEIEGEERWGGEGGRKPD